MTTTIQPHKLQELDSGTFNAVILYDDLQICCSAKRMVDRLRMQRRSVLHLMTWRVQQLADGKAREMARSEMENANLIFAATNLDSDLLVTLALEISRMRDLGAKTLVVLWKSNEAVDLDGLPAMELLKTLSKRTGMRFFIQHYRSSIPIKAS